MIPKEMYLPKFLPASIFFLADDQPTKGTFHVNFTFDPNKDNYLALYDSDGTTLIDEVTIPAGQKADVSYGLDLDGVGNWSNP